MNREEIAEHVGKRVKLNGKSDLAIHGELKGFIKSPAKTYLTLDKLSTGGMAIITAPQNKTIVIPPHNVDLYYENDKSNPAMKLYKHVYHTGDKTRITGFRLGYDEKNPDNYIVGLDAKSQAGFTPEDVIDIIEFIKGRIQFRKEFNNMTKSGIVQASSAVIKPNRSERRAKK